MGVGGQASKTMKSHLIMVYPPLPNNIPAMLASDIMLLLRMLLSGSLPD